MLAIMPTEFPDIEAAEAREMQDDRLSDLSERIGLALDIIHNWGGIDGAHHKAWCLDQIARALTGSTCAAMEPAPVTQYQTPEYEQFVRDCKEGDDGPDTYEYDCGITP